MATFSRGRYATKIQDVVLLGHHGKLHWRVTLQGLEIDLPDQPPCEHAYVFKIVR